LTGYGRAVDREQAVAAGFDAHLVKPVDTRMLLSLLAPDSSGSDDARVRREPRVEVEAE
jgi:CheY-like chemotaxis protein